VLIIAISRRGAAMPVVKVGNCTFLLWNKEKKAKAGANAIPSEIGAENVTFEKLIVFK
jgi:hypothetical protein